MYNTQMNRNNGVGLLCVLKDSEDMNNDIFFLIADNFKHSITLLNNINITLRK